MVASVMSWSCLSVLSMRDLQVDAEAARGRFSPRGSVGEARVAGVGDGPVGGPLVGGHHAGRQAGVAVVGELDRGERVPGVDVGLVERDALGGDGAGDRWGSAPPRRRGCSRARGGGGRPGCIELGARRGRHRGRARAPSRAREPGPPRGPARASGARRRRAGGALSAADSARRHRGGAARGPSPPPGSPAASRSTTRRGPAGR